MAKPSHKTKIILALAAALVIAAAGFGYLNQVAKLDTSTAEAANSMPTTEQTVLSPKPTDIILGDNNAVITMVEYSSLSCPHCAHFHTDILPTLEKEFITPGKLKLVMRHFPINEPAMRGAQTVECAEKNGLNSTNFIKVLFDMQAQWAFGESYREDLKKIASVGGLDSAAFDSCLADQGMENAILASRQEGEEKLHITGTPSFFINGMKYSGEVTLEGLRKAIEGAGTGKRL